MPSRPLSPAWRVALGLALLGAGACSADKPTGSSLDRSRPSPRPSAPQGVVVILADDAGLETFGFCGGESYATPRLDDLAAESLHFTQFHAQPLCTPSRVKLLTGRSNLVNYRRFSVLDPSERTFAHALRDQGYTTAVAGKWQLYGARHYGEWAGIGARPEEAGFDRWCLWQVEELGPRYWKPLLEVDGELVQYGDGDYGPRVFMDYAVSFLEEHREKPFLLYLPLALVHDPFAPTPDSAPREERDLQANFADMMAEMDRSVGVIVDALDRLGLRETTLLAFTSDNGTSTRITSMRRGVPVVGGKRSNTARGTHVPLLVRAPWLGLQAGVHDSIHDLSDIAPTLAELAGATWPAPTASDGRSFADHLWGEGLPCERGSICVYSDPRPGNDKFPPALFVRTERYKLYSGGEFYDVLLDPEEQQALDVGTLGAAARDQHRLLLAKLAALPAPNEQLGGEALRARR